MNTKLMQQRDTVVGIASVIKSRITARIDSFGCCSGSGNSSMLSNGTDPTVGTEVSDISRFSSLKVMSGF